MITRLWPGLTWFNIWDLPLDVWLLYARQHDAWLTDGPPL